MLEIPIFLRRAHPVDGRLKLAAEQPPSCERLPGNWDENYQAHHSSWQPRANALRMGCRFDGSIMPMPRHTLQSLAESHHSEFTTDAVAVLQKTDGWSKTLDHEHLLVMRRCLEGTAGQPFSFQTGLRRGEMDAAMRPLSATEAVAAMLLYWRRYRTLLFVTHHDSTAPSPSFTRTSTASVAGFRICLGWKDNRIDARPLPDHRCDPEVGLALGMNA